MLCLAPGATAVGACPACGRTVGGVDELISQALSNGLDVAESGVAGTGGDQVDRLEKNKEAKRKDERRSEFCKQNAPRERRKQSARLMRPQPWPPSFPPPAPSVPPFTHLVDAAQGRHINGLAADDTAGANAGGVLAGAALGNGVSDDLQRVGASHQVDDLHGVLEGGRQ
jgi:hypothetical protein